MAEMTFLTLLRDGDLLSREQLSELAPLPEARNPDPRVLARVVLQRGWLTRFQINQVAMGKGKDLLVGPYLLLDRLGEGGMGQVFKARHRHMKRVVALKLIRKEKLDGADSVARFYQEVEAAAQLHHPNIVLAFDAGQAGGTHFFAMEYVEGPDLTRLVRERGTLPVTQACEFIRQAAVGLQHAHERGLVHRDIKPSNLLVTETAAGPVVKILDLGLARLGDSFAKERNLTKMGQVIGTPDYLAPEQALDAHKADIRADIYSLGCSLYFLLSAHAPFQAGSLTELLMKHQMNDPTPIRPLRPDVPPALEALLGRMMAKKPQDRPATPAEVAEALEPFARGELSVGGPSPLSISVELVAPAHGETWASLSSDGAVLPRPAARAARSRDTIEERPRGRRKKQKRNKRLVIAGALGAVGVFALVILGVALFSPKKPVKPVEKRATPGTPQQEEVPREVLFDGADPKEQPAAKPGGDGVLLAAVAKGVRAGHTVRTKEVGGQSGTLDYTDVPPRGALLTGLEVGVGGWNNQDIVYYLRPVYQSRRGRLLGPVFGEKQERTYLLEAKPGYAISGLTVSSGATLDSIRVQFMAIKEASLDPADFYWSDAVGGAAGGSVTTLGGDGTPVVGLFGKSSVRAPAGSNGVGLVLLSKTAPVPADVGTADAERKAAEWVLSLGGSVRVEGKDKNLGAAADLPRERFRLTWVDLPQNKQVSDAGLARLMDCKSLNHLDLRGTQVSDAGLAFFHNYKSLTFLDLRGTVVNAAKIAELKEELPDCRIEWDGGVVDPAATPDRKASEWVLSIGGTVHVKGEATEIKAAKDLPKGRFRLTRVELVGNKQVGDADLARLENCKSLWRLDLSQTQVGDAGLAHFKGCTDLRNLDLGKTNVTGTGLVHFKDCEGLSILDLSGTPVSDAGLSHLDAFKNLSFLYLRKTKVSARKIAELKKSLPQCTIEWDGGVIQPTGEIDRRAAEWVLSIGGTVGINEDTTSMIKAVTDLPQERFRLTGVGLNNNKQVSDAGLACFKDCKNLTFLNLVGTPVGYAGLANFKNCKELTGLYLANTPVSDASLAHFKNCKKLTALSLSGTQVSDLGLAHFANCKELTSLNLGKTRVSDVGIARFRNCKDLKVLILIDTQVGDAGLIYFKGSKNITSLFLAGTRVTDAGLSQFAGCKNLEFLNVRRTKVSARLVERLSKALPDCKIIHP